MQDQGMDFNAIESGDQHRKTDGGLLGVGAADTSRRLVTFVDAADSIHQPNHAHQRGPSKDHQRKHGSSDGRGIPLAAIEQR